MIEAGKSCDSIEGIKTKFTGNKIGGFGLGLCKFLPIS